MKTQSFKKIAFSVLLLSVLSFGLLSCKKSNSNTPDNNTGETPEQIISLNKTEADMLIGDTLQLIPTFESTGGTYTWKIEDENVVKKIAENEDTYALTLVATAKGKISVSIASADKKQEATCVITVTDDGIVKILAIGNSFSEDAVEHYLYGLADAENIKVVIGNMYVGGASLSTHWNNASNNNAVYQYRKIDTEGNKTNTKNTSIATAVADERWDYISFQQVSHQSGQYESFVSPFPKLFDYVETRTTNPNVKYIYHQTWAYAKNSDHSQFSKYDHNQMTMYDAIVDAVWKAVELVPIDFVIPAGTAIQNGRTSSIGDHFNRDGYHLNAIGQYTAASTWFEAIFGINVIGNTFTPTGLTETEVEIAQTAAHEAVSHPKEVTELTAFQTPPQPLNAPVFIGFGTKAPLPDGWNAFIGNAGVVKGSTLTNLIDKNDNGTGINVEITKRFFNYNTNGVSNASAAFDIPANVSKYNFYGNARKERGSNNLKVEESEITLSRLDKTEKYDFCFFSSRNGVSDNRETKFIVKGDSEKTASLNATNNSTETVCVKDIKPDADGNVKITVTIGDNNDNEWGFYYLTAMKIASSD